LIVGTRFQKQLSEFNLEIIAILIGLAIFAAVAFYVSRPLVESRSTLKSDGVDAFSLETQRESLYTQIKELDLDHATGKVNDEDHARLRAALVAQAAEVLKQIDGVAPRPPVIPPTKPIAPTAAAGDDDVEALIAARRKTRSAAAPPKTSDADIEAAITARRKTTAPTIGSAALVCPKCGRSVNADDVFCAKCGTALQPQATP
jgi:hypothetical protein